MTSFKSMTTCTKWFIHQSICHKRKYVRMWHDANSMSCQI
uniref:Uncharacterized protein n=1 Tax=Rhizophora mucronata TaxID=61149 RepID=A0A2P2NEB7_RHIMU